jgi:uncharacterized protein
VVAGSVFLSIALGLIAAAYAAVGQGGATGYIAILSILGFGPDIIRPTALALNFMVSAIAMVQFGRAGLINWRTILPLALLGVPCSLLGGATHLSAAVYRPLVGILLLVAAWQMAASARRSKNEADHGGTAPTFGVSLIAGAVIGFIAGVTGIGGGILLAPLALTLGWASTRQTSAMAAVFNMLNSGAAFVGLWLTVPSLPTLSPWWFVATACGGLIGASLGARRFPTWILRYALAAILVVAGGRMFWA